MILPRRASAVAAAFAFFLPLLTRCEAWEDAPPPASPAGGANVNAAAVAPVDPGPPAPLAPVPPPPESGTAEDGARYASGEYAVGADADAYDDNDPAALRDFRGVLDTHGAWVDDPTYGTVWTPSATEVGADFKPYVTGGHWTYDDDYVWASDYSWGWAPFHYGRWVFVDGRGWVWIPGREYRGAWVTWSVDDGYSYLGWAPMGPAFVWFGGVPMGWHGYWGSRWAYVPRGEVFAPRVGARVVVGPAAVTIASRMRPYVADSARTSAGPSPARFGYQPAQIPRATGTAAASVAHAQQFARPSTAQAIGASPPTRFEAGATGSSVPMRSSMGEGSRGPAAEQGPSRVPTVSTGPRATATGPNVSRAQGTADTARAPARGFTPAPQGRPSGGGSRGGGGHRH
jgi:hypothetical protein